MPQAIREGIFTIIFISGPLVVLAAVLGLSVGIIQAATQIQEQTLASAVKIIGLFLALIVFGFYMFQYLKQYATENIERAFRLVPSLGNYVKPRNNFLSRPVEGESSEPGVPVPGLRSQPKTGSSTGKLGDELNEPEYTNINEGKTADSLGMPQGQVKDEDTNLQKIDEGQLHNIEASDDQAEAQTTAPEPQKPSVFDQPVVRPAPAQPVQQEPFKPKLRPRKSLTGALDRIRSSLEDGDE